MRDLVEELFPYSIFLDSCLGIIIKLIILMIAGYLIFHA